MPHPMNFSDVLAHAKSERAKLDHLIAFLEPLVHATEPLAVRKGGRQRLLKGTDALVFGAIKSGEQTANELGKALKLKDGVVRDSLKRLVADRRIEIVTGSWPRAYKGKGK